MKHILYSMVAMFVLNVGPATLATAAEPMAEDKGQSTQGQGAYAVQGEVVKIDGEFYVVQDSRGKEVRLHVDKRTALIGNIEQGSKVEAQFTQSGHASMLKTLRK